MHPSQFPFESKGVGSEAGMLLGVAIRLKKVVGVNFKVEQYPNFHTLDFFLSVFARR